MYDVRAETVQLLQNTPKTRLKKTIQRLGKLAEAKKTLFFQKDGIVEDSREVEDNRTQLDANKFIAELHGAKAPEKQEHAHRFENAMSLVTRARSEEEGDD